MTTTLKKPHIELVSASAGSGKTHELMVTIIDAIKKGLDPSKLIAVTFTERAASEIASRIRGDLAKEGLFEEARNISAARVGTVHAVCARLIEEFCFELGRSPEQKVLSEKEATQIFERAIAKHLSETRLHEIERLERALGKDPSTKMFGASDDDDEKSKGFLEEIRKVLKMARDNAIDADGLRASAKESIERMSTFFPAASSIDPKSTLHDELKKYKNRWPTPPSEHGITAKAHGLVLSAAHAVARGEDLTWADWAKLSGLSPSVKVIEHFRPIIEASSLHASSPGLKKDMSESIQLIFDIAADVLEEFSQLKQEMGVCDFSDLERETLTLISLPEVKSRLQGELDLVLVDEFQDTSPVQLAIFLELASLAKRSVWVGDIKQSIFAFRGADPELMTSVIQEVADGEAKVLGHNWRSRKELVEFSSEVFSEAFQVDGIDKKHIVQKVPDKRSGLPFKGDALQVWRFVPSNAKATFPVLAKRVKKLIDDETHIVDRKTEKSRKMTFNDVAILCRSNQECKELSEALHEIGLSSSFESSELIKDPFVSLAVACFRVLISSNDTAAAAEVALGFGANHDAWLKQSMNDIESTEWSPVIQSLSEARENSHDTSVADKLEIAFRVADLESVIERTEGGARSLKHLTALKKFALAYEESCRSLIQPCTATGFLEALYDESPAVPSDQSDNAVTVMTYHKSKGLEWPVVILTSLQKEGRSGSPFNQFYVRLAKGKKFNSLTPLDHRRIHYLPWPYGATKKIEAIDAILDTSHECAKNEVAARAEQRRLLYVGVTRARDHLIFFDCLKKPAKETVLGTLIEGAKDTWAFPLEIGKPLQMNKLKFKCHLELLEAVEESVSAVASKSKSVKNRALPVTSEVKEAPRLLTLNPSTITTTDAKAFWKFDAKTSGPIELSQKPIFIEEVVRNNDKDKTKLRFNIIGSAVHLFLASDRPELTHNERLDLATTILNRWDAARAVKADELVQASDRLKNFINEKWPKGQLLREIPIEMAQGDQLITGWIDAMVVTESEVAIIDHKASLARIADAKDSALKYEAQLATYSEATKRAYPNHKVTTWIHNPNGWVVEVKL